MLGTGHFIFERVTGQMRKKFLHGFAKEIKIVHSSTKQRSIMQAGEILQKNIAHPPHPPQTNGPSFPFSTTHFRDFKHDKTSWTDFFDDQS